MRARGVSSPRDKTSMEATHPRNKERMPVRECTKKMVNIKSEAYSHLTCLWPLKINQGTKQAISEASYVVASRSPRWPVNIHTASAQKKAHRPFRIYLMDSFGVSKKAPKIKQSSSTPPKFPIMASLMGQTWRGYPRQGDD